MKTKNKDGALYEEGIRNIFRWIKKENVPDRPPAPGGAIRYIFFFYSSKYIPENLAIYKNKGPKQAQKKIGVSLPLTTDHESCEFLPGFGCRGLQATSNPAWKICGIPLENRRNFYYAFIIFLLDFCEIPIKSYMKFRRNYWNFVWVSSKFLRNYWNFF